MTKLCLVFYPCLEVELPRYKQEQNLALCNLFLKDFLLTSLSKRQPTANLALQPTNTEQNNHKSLQTQESHHSRKEQFLSSRHRKKEQARRDLSSALIGSDTRSCKTKGLRSAMITCSLSSFLHESWMFSSLCNAADKETNFKPRSLRARHRKPNKETVGLIQWLGTTKHRFVFLVKWVVMNKGSWFSVSRGSVLC